MKAKVTGIAILLVFCAILLGFMVNPDDPKIVAQFTIGGLVLAMLLVFFVAVSSIMKSQPPLREHLHPDNGVPIYGTRLTPGEVLRETDYYASTNGTWEKNTSPRSMLEKDCSVIWVRPAKQ